MKVFFRRGESAPRAVAIVARRAHHAAQALAALRASKDIFIGKPMTLTANSRPETYRVFNNPVRRLTLCFNKRFAPFYAETKCWLVKDYADQF